MFLSARDSAIAQFPFMVDTKALQAKLVELHALAVAITVFGYHHYHAHIHSSLELFADEKAVFFSVAHYVRILGPFFGFPREFSAPSEALRQAHSLISREAVKEAALSQRVNKGSGGTSGSGGEMLRLRGGTYGTCGHCGALNVEIAVHNRKTCTRYCMKGNCAKNAGCARNARDRGGKLRHDRSDRGGRDRRDEYEDRRWRPYDRDRRDDRREDEREDRKFRNVRFDEDKNSDRGRETETSKKK